MSRSLDSIKKPINEALNAFEGHFRKAMESQVPLLDKITFYLVKRKGKQFLLMRYGKIKLLFLLVTISFRKVCCWQ